MDTFLNYTIHVTGKNVLEVLPNINLREFHTQKMPKTHELVKNHRSAPSAHNTIIAIPACDINQSETRVGDQENVSDLHLSRVGKAIQRKCCDQE